MRSQSQEMNEYSNLYLYIYMYLDAPCSLHEHVDASGDGVSGQPAHLAQHLLPLPVKQRPDIRVVVVYIYACSICVCVYVHIRM